MEEKGKITEMKFSFKVEGDMDIKISHSRGIEVSVHFVPKEIFDKIPTRAVEKAGVAWKDIGGITFFHAPGWHNPRPNRTQENVRDITLGIESA